MNKAQKGHNKEYQARKELEKEGWLIVFKSIRYRFGCIDFAQLFDISAYKPITETPCRKFISCKHFNGYYLQHQEEIKNFKLKYGLPNESYELWIWKESCWTGKGDNKIWEKAHWIKIVI